MLNYIHMKRIAFFLSAIGLLLSPLATFAAPAPGELVKGSGPAVYYYAADGKRYVFPNEKTYFTWYSNFDGVVTVTDAELAAIPLGKNITYRPGTRMLKIESDPKVYAVGKNGLLRWVETEPLAESLYGSNWAGQIDDISVAFFTSYTLGPSIDHPSDFNPTDAKNASMTIQQDRSLTAPEPMPEPEPEPSPEPEPTSNVRANLSLSTSEAEIGDVVDAYVTADPSASIKEIYIYLGPMEVGFCRYSPCGASFELLPGMPEYVVRAEIEWITGETATQSESIELIENGSQGIHILVTNPEVEPGGILEAQVLVDSTHVAGGIGLFINGNLVDICDLSQECRYSQVVEDEVGYTYTLFAQIINFSATIISSGIRTVKVVENAHPLIDLSLGKEYIFAGETIDATLEAFDTDGIVSTDIWLDGVLVKHCDIHVCTAVTSPIFTTGTHRLTGAATDGRSLEATKTVTFEVR